MAFSDFNLKTVRERFGLTIDERQDLFSRVASEEVPTRLREMLDEWAPAALAMNTEKAKSAHAGTLSRPALILIGSSCRSIVPNSNGTAAVALPSRSNCWAPVRSIS